MVEVLRGPGRRPLAALMASTIAMVAACAPPPPPPPPAVDAEHPHHRSRLRIPPPMSVARPSREPAPPRGVLPSTDRARAPAGLPARLPARAGPIALAVPGRLHRPPGLATGLDSVGFAHNAAIMQVRACFTLLHRGTAAPAVFLRARTAASGVLPTGGGRWAASSRRTAAGLLGRDGEGSSRPPPGDGLPWHPRATWLATYDATISARLDFKSPCARPSSPRSPVLYGYAVASDDRPQLPVRQHLPAEPRLDGGSGAVRTRPRRCGWPGCRGVSSSRRPVPDGTGWWPTPTRRSRSRSATGPRTPCSRGYLDGRWMAVDEGERLLGRRVAIDVARQPLGAVDDGAGRSGHGTGRRPAPEHLPSPPAPVAGNSMAA